MKTCVVEVMCMDVDHHRVCLLHSSGSGDYSCGDYSFEEAWVRFAAPMDTRRSLHDDLFRAAHVRIVDGEVSYKEGV